MHKPAIPNGREHDRKRKIEAQNAGTHTAVRERDRMSRPKSYIVEDPAILAKRNFAFGAAIEIIKN